MQPFVLGRRSLALQTSRLHRWTQHQRLIIMFSLRHQRSRRSWKKRSGAGIGLGYANAVRKLDHRREERSGWRRGNSVSMERNREEYGGRDDRLRERNVGDVSSFGSIGEKRRSESREGIRRHSPSDESFEHHRFAFQRSRRSTTIGSRDQKSFQGVTRRQTEHARSNGKRHASAADRLGLLIEYRTRARRRFDVIDCGYSCRRHATATPNANAGSSEIACTATITAIAACSSSNADHVAVAESFDG